MRIMAAFYEDFRNLSAYAEDHGLSARGWMRPPQLSHSCVPGLMLRRIPLLADNPPKPWHFCTETFQHPLGVGGYFMKGPRALPVGLHNALLF
jgi:hypothetical protein